MRDLMIDLETMGLSPDGAIVSIGALYFDLHTGETGHCFEMPVNLESAVRLGMTIYPSTVNWWFGQSKAAVDGWRTPQAVDIQTALNEFSAWVGRHSIAGPRSSSRVWANAPAFDLSILRTAFDLAKMSTPWHFKQERCVRTIADLGRDVMEGRPVGKSRGVAHNALDDCRYQVEYCHAAWKALVG